MTSWNGENATNESGTTLIAMAADDGILMAADDLVYAEQKGEIIPIYSGIQKVFLVGKNILIGSAGLMRHPQIGYKFEEWISNFMEIHRSNSNQLPSEIAAALYDQMMDTFKPLESLPENSIWRTHIPGDRLVSYLVAGYAKSFQQSYFFEIGVEINKNRDGLIYLSPMHKRTNNLFFGEDEFFLRAVHEKEPQHSDWQKIMIDIGPLIEASLPDIPEPLQQAVASTVGLIQVEAKFNPKKVGTSVAVGVIDRTTKTPYIVTL